MKNSNELKRKIIELIDSKIEGNYWDFKKQYSDKTQDLIHDILCLSNSNSDSDKYLIYGISDAPECKIVGIDNDKNRKNLSDITDTLSKSSFIDNQIPTIELVNFKIRKKTIDVLVIKNLPKFKPYYITKNCGKVNAYNIYSRINNTNIAKDKSLPTYELEILWKNRFGILTEPYQRFLNLLKQYDKWEIDIGNKDFAYHKVHTEFTIHFEKYEIDEPGFEKYFTAPICYSTEAHLCYQGSKLKILRFYQADDGRVPIGEPKFQQLDYEKRLYYFYYQMDEENGVFHYFLTKSKIENVDRMGDIYCYFLFFNSEAERKRFNEHCKRVINAKLKRIQDKIETPVVANKITVNFIPDYYEKYHILIREIYNKWRLKHPLILEY